VLAPRSFMHSLAEASFFCDTPTYRIYVLGLSFFSGFGQAFAIMELLHV